MNYSPKFRHALLLCLTILAFACAPASAAPAPKLKISSPVAGVVPLGKIAIRANLSAKRSVHVKVAVFYLNGKRVTTDRSYPFKVKAGIKFDTRSLPAAGRLLKLKVKYTRRAPGGKPKTRSLSRQVRISLKPTGTVTGESTCDRGPTEPGTLLDEEFNACPLDTSIWNPQRSDVRSGGLPYYPFNDIEGAGYSTSDKNVSVDGGSAQLTVTDDQIGDDGSDGKPKHLYPKSTGMLNTDGLFSFKYGYVETRVMVPKCSLCWPSFWMMPAGGGWPPEVDIFEFINSEVAPYPWATIHWQANTPPPADGTDTHFDNDSTPKQAYTNYKPAGTSDLTGAWHTYGMRWSQNSLKFYIDGVLGAEVSNPARVPQEPMYLIYMMAIGDPAVVLAKFGASFAPAPAGSQMKIDYLRVWPLENSPV